MFGWLATRSTPLCHHAPPALASRRSCRVNADTLLRKLPALGSVLYLHNDAAFADTDALPPGVLVSQRAFAPLLHTHWLVAISVVTDDGPREWCECVDRFGRTRARLHLLPDTDYLAWDALMMSNEGHTDPVASIDVRPLQADAANVLHFRVRELAGLLLLEQDIPAVLSPLSSCIAARIASAESAVFDRVD